MSDCTRLLGLATNRFANLTEPIGGGDSTIHQEVTPGDERAFRTHQQRRDRRHFIRRAGTNDLATSIAALQKGLEGTPAIGKAAGTLAEASMLAYEVQAANRSPHRTASAITRSEFPRFAI